MKVLDFGLAKALDTSPDADPSESPTLTAAATQMGVIMGTAAYMSPEQAAGKPVDERIDIWAFGAVLFEMLTGQQPFTGETVSHVLAAVLKTEPDWSLLPSGTPSPLRTLMRRCLTRARRSRLHHIADARVEIEEVQGGHLVETPPPRPVGARLSIVWGLVGVLVGSLFTGAVVWNARTESSMPTQRLSMTFPPSAGFAPAPGSMALSRDGRTLVYLGFVDDGSEVQLYQRSLHSFDAHPIRDSLGARHPTVSPNGEWVAFFAGGELRKVSLAGGGAIPLCEWTGGDGATWESDDTIIFATRDGLSRVSADGGEPQALTTLDAEAGEIGARVADACPRDGCPALRGCSTRRRDGGRGIVGDGCAAPARKRLDTSVSPHGSPGVCARRCPLGSAVRRRSA